MTSNTTNNQWLRTATPAFSRPASYTALPRTKSTPRSYPRNGFSDVSSHSNSDGEPFVKRQKLDNERGKPRAEAQDHLVASDVQPTRILSAEHNAGDRSTEDMLFQSASASSPAKQKDLRSGPPLLPLRPGRKQATNASLRADLAAAHRNASRGTVQSKPYVVESPSFAPRFDNDACADFHPWTGQHPEDVLNESTTKNGFYDKVHISQNETSTAKNAIWSSLKHKSGIQILSSLFVAALDQRQAHGVVTANCTFKPPPRVTLTDTKRETWLRDLANPDILLRRLSRTIPHGIRGKVLLDQCLAKSIPTSRAVWLAKCVGANEIRAFKRKGAGGAFAVGGESKWIKDWTSSVEQFIESVVGMCGSLDWRSRIDYGLRLASHLSSEHLLDQDHYLSWVLSSLHTCDLDVLPFWMLVMRIHLDELLQQRKRGRRLIEALIAQLHKASVVLNDEVYHPIIQALLESLKSFIVSHPKWFIMPSLWHKYESVLRPYIEGECDEPILKVCFERVSEQNLRLLMKAWNMKHQDWRPPDTAQQRLIAILDAAPYDPNFSRLTNECLQVTDNFDLLVATCLEWASTPHRQGDEKIYFSARLLRQCSRVRSGLDESIMNFLAANAGLTGLSTARVYRLIAEMIRSKHLAPGRYLSWLMARGQLRGCPKPDLDGLCDARLLLEMPFHGVPSHVLNLRQILMSRIGASVRNEDIAIACFKTQISQMLPGLFSLPEEDTDLRPPSSEMRESSIAVRHAIASWIRQTVAARFSSGQTKNIQKPKHHGLREAVPPDTTLQAVSLTHFRSIRKLLEDLGDFTILADVLRLVTDSEDNTVLAAASDTVCYHLNIFAAIGAHASLFHDLFQQYESMRQDKDVDLSLLESLIDLGKCIPKAEKETKHLKQQALLCQQNSSAVAFSPISDTMAEALQSAESTFAEDVEQVLTSGTSIDKQTLGQLFSAITKRLEASWLKQDPSKVGFGEFLLRLRGFGPPDFDGFLCDWIGHVLSNPARPGLGEVFLPLICNGCLTLKRVLDLSASVLDGPSPGTAPAVLAMDVIEMLSAISTDEALATEQRHYRCRLQYDRCVRRHPKAIIPFFRAILQSCTGVGSRTQKQATVLFRQPAIRILVNDLATYDPQALIDLGRSLGKQALLFDMDDRTNDGALLDRDIESQLRRILDHVNCFNIPLCRLKLEAVLSEAATRSEAPVAILLTLFEKRSLMSATFKKLLPSLFSGLPSEHATPIRHCLESEILSRLLCNEQPLDDATKELLVSLLRIVEANAGVKSEEAMFPAVARIAEKLNVILSSHRPADDHSDSDGLGDSGDFGRHTLDDLCEVDILLRLLAVHQTTIQHPKFPQENLYVILTSLSFLLTHPPLIKRPPLNDYLYNVLMLLSDSLSEESRTRCIITLRDHHLTHDPRLISIFGFSASTDVDWLHLINHAPAEPEVKHLDTAGFSVKAGTQVFSLRRWEMMQDATPFLGDNDASLSLTLFGTRKSIL